jgi:uncharacterized protein YecE (DUF72 family)
MMATAHSVAWVGTSGWQYADWRGSFYPQQLAVREWLDAYASVFVTTEVNNTFYRLPPSSTFERWDRTTPDGFVMAVKASRYLTHIKRLRDPQEPVDRLLTVTTALGSTLGPVLFQLPPTLRADIGLLTGLLDAIHGRVRTAVEFRHASWSDTRVFDLLQERGAALVLAHKPGVRWRPRVTADWTYVRFHQGSSSGAAYRSDTLRRWADGIAHLGARESFVYFNNDPGGAAPRDARRFCRLLRSHGITVPTP